MADKETTEKFYQEMLSVLRRCADYLVAPDEHDTMQTAELYSDVCDAIERAE